MEQYVFSLTDDTFFRLVQQRTENSGLPQERVEEIAAFCRYAYVGFFLQFLWNRMGGGHRPQRGPAGGADDRLCPQRHGGAGELNFRISRQKCPK